MTLTLAPAPKFIAFDTTGITIPGALLFTYETGSSTKLETYTDALGTVAHANPIVMDAAGRATIYLLPTQYKFVLAPVGSPDPPTSPIWTVDPVGAVPTTEVDLDVQAVAGEDLVAGRPVYLSDSLDGNTAGVWYEADSVSSLNSTEPEIFGMPVADINSGDSGAVRLAGRITGLSGLTIGSTYYIGNGGGLEVVAVNNPRKVGVADTATSLVMSDKRIDSPIMVASTSTVTGNVGAGEDTLYTYVAGRSQLWRSHMGWRGLYWGATANNANAKTLRIRINDGTNPAIALIEFALTANEAGRWILDFALKRTSATGFIARASSMVGPENGPVSASGTKGFSTAAPALVDFSAEVSIIVTGEATTNNDIAIWGGQVYVDGISF